MDRNEISLINTQENSHWWHKSKLFFIHFFNPQLSKFNKGKVLDIGCGTGNFLLSIKKNRPNIIGVDNEDLCLKIATRKGLPNLIKQDLNKKLKVKSRSIDEVYCLDVLEHINKDVELISEINRVLKNKGNLTLFVPAIQSIYSYWDKKLGHFRRYSRADLIETLQENNFAVEYSTYFFFFTLPLTTMVRFIKTLTKSNNTDFFPLPNWINQFLFTLSKFEGKIAKIFPIPIGSSILIIARKK